MECNSKIKGPSPPPQNLLIRKNYCNSETGRHLSPYLRITSPARPHSIIDVPMAPRPPPPPPPRPPWPTPPPSPGNRPYLSIFQTSCRPITPSTRTRMNRNCKASECLRFKTVTSHIHESSLKKSTPLSSKRCDESKNLEMVGG